MRLFKDIYPFELNVEKANRFNNQANDLNLTLIIGENNGLYTKLYDKRDDFNFLHLSSNILSGPSYGVYNLQLLSYARC